MKGTHSWTRERPPTRTCGMEHDEDSIPSCLPDVGTIVQLSGVKTARVLYYEYYVRGQKTFPVMFDGCTHTLTMEDVVKVVERHVEHAAAPVVDIADRRTRQKSPGKRAKATTQRTAGEEQPAISARGVC